MNTSSRFVVAVHILTGLTAKAQVGDRCGCDYKATSDEIAESVNTNPVVIRRILGQLQEAGLVVSKTGRSGGTMLAKAADQITLRDVHEAVEDGDLFHMHYNTPNQACPIGSNIQDAVCDLFRQASEAVQQVLATKTVADVAADVLERSGIQARLEAGMTPDEIKAELAEQASPLLAP